MKMLKMVLAAGSLSLIAGGCVAQEIRDCAKDGSCVEFTVRYYKSDRADKPERVEILDSQKKDVLVSEKYKCDIGKTCKLGNLQHLQTLTLMQTYNPHYCYQVCYGGWCYIRCPAHP